MSSNNTFQEDQALPEMSSILQTPELMEALCYLICHSSAKTTSEQRMRLTCKMEEDARMEALMYLELPPSPILNAESVFENECPPLTNDILENDDVNLPPLESVETDDWIQCDTCEKWHKFEITGKLPNEWYCSDMGKMCRPPQKAENYWPAKRAKLLVKHFSDLKRAPNHMKCLQFLAKRKGITLEQLYKTRPEDYVGDRDIYNRIMYGYRANHWPYLWY